MVWIASLMIDLILNRTSLSAIYSHLRLASLLLALPPAKHIVCPSLCSIPCQSSYKPDWCFNWTVKKPFYWLVKRLTSIVYPKISTESENLNLISLSLRVYLPNFRTLYFLDRLCVTMRASGTHLLIFYKQDTHGYLKFMSVY